MHRRKFLELATISSGIIAGCSAQPDTSATDSPTEGSPKPTETGTAEPTSKVTETNDDTQTSDSRKPQIVESTATFVDVDTLRASLTGEDLGGIRMAQIQTSGDSIQKQGNGDNKITLEGTLGAGLRDNVKFILEDTAGNVRESSTEVCYEAPIGKHLVKYGQPMELGWDEPEIVEYDGQYYLFYRIGGGGDKIALATSTDGIEWDKKGVVLDQGSNNAWDNNYVISPSYIHYNDEHYLFYEGNDGHISRIGWAKSDTIDGPYEKSSENPVLNPSQDGGIEDVLVGTPAAIVREDGTVYLYYHGWDAEHDRLAVARSRDRVNWEKAPSNPIIDVKSDTWYSAKVAPSDVTRYNGTDYVFIEGDDGEHWRSGLALADDPFEQINLVDYNPILDIGQTGSFDDTHAHTPSSLITRTDRGQELWLYYQGNDGSAYRLSRASQPIC